MLGGWLRGPARTTAGLPLLRPQTETMNLGDIVSTLVLAVICYIYREQLQLVFLYLVEASDRLLQARLAAIAQGHQPLVVDETEQQTPVQRFSGVLCCTEN